MSAENYYVPETPAPFERLYVLPEVVPAFQILPADETGKPHLGLMIHLPQGAELEVSGPGFNDRTVRVRCGSASYFVFTDDLRTVRKGMAAAMYA
jgi:hypothetical protein